MKSGTGENAKNRDWKTPMSMPGADKRAAESGSGPHPAGPAVQALRREAAPNEMVPESTRRLAQEKGKRG